VNRPRSGRTVAFGIGLAALLGVAAVLLYAFFVEPYWVELTRHSLAGEVAQPLRIAQLSDLHSSGYGMRERRLVRLVEQAAPDLIVLTGDTVSGGSLEPSRELLTHLRAPLGVWAVMGDGERNGGGGDTQAFYASVGAHLLPNKGAAVRDDVWLMGLDDPVTGHPDINAALVGAPASSFKIALFHAPDHFAAIAGLFHLALAGHTHGGQVRIPGIGPLWQTPQGRRYEQGWYNEKSSNLYVSRGIGTTFIPARLLSRPEVALIDIRPN
jgi:predicted MPP superfamily phosphohydrolase